MVDKNSNNKVIKTNLARLLATENISVEYGDYPTASFHPKRRHLELPNWSHTSNNVHDLLVGHEVGHAVFTPIYENKLFTDIDEQRPGLVHMYMNVVEDARIEREIKSKFPGLKRSFFRGYKTLFEEDRFKIGDRQPDDFNLLDRINLFFKVGNHIQIPFSEEEKPFVDRIENTKSFDEVMNIVRDLYEYSKKKAEEKQQEMEDSETSDHKFQLKGDDDTEEGYEDFDSVPNPLENSDSGDGDGDDQSSESDDSSEDNNGNSELGNDSRDDIFDSLQSETSKGLSDSLQDMVDRQSGNWNDNSVPYYFYIPKVNSDDFIVPLNEVHQHIGAHYQHSVHLVHQSDFVKFKRDNQKVVNYMAKEFDLKKNAEQMSRVSVSKTGVIDVNKLHSYKYNDDLFRRVTSIPGGKNHGIVMFVDWSGSMSDSITNVIRQAMTLAMFCKKVDIPFNLYGFTDNSMLYDELEDVQEKGLVRYGFPHVSYRHKDLKIQNFRLREYLNSSLNNRAFDKAMYNMFLLSVSFENGHWANVPFNEQLSSTPLNDAIIIAHDLIPKFRQSYKLEKVTSIWLTDGDSNSADYRYTGHGSPLDNYTYSYHKRIVVNRDTKVQYQAKSRSEMTNALLESLRESTQIETVGFFVLSRQGVRSVRNRVPINNINEAKIKSINRTKSAIFHDVQGYSEYYAIKGGSDLETETEELNIERGAKKGKITTAFKKHTKNRTAERVVLNSLVDLIA